MFREILLEEILREDDMKTQAEGCLKMLLDSYRKEGPEPRNTRIAVLDAEEAKSRGAVLDPWSEAHQHFVCVQGNPFHISDSIAVRE